MVMGDDQARTYHSSFASSSTLEVALFIWGKEALRCRNLPPPTIFHVAAEIEQAQLMAQRIPLIHKPSNV